MIEIRYHAHPMCKAEVLQVSSLAVWLLDQPRDTPLALYAGGKLLGCPDDVLGATGPVIAVREPGIETITWAAVQAVLVQAATSIALSYVIGALTASGGASNDANANRTTKSPNNQLGARDNQVRVLERVEEIFGRVKSIPSLMMPTYFKYVNHRQVEYGYYCIGRGYYDVSELRDGDTLLSDFSRASAAVYAPFTSPQHGTPQLQIGPAITDPVLTAQRNEQVDGITLQPLNKLQIIGAQTWDLDGATGRITQKTGYPGIGTIAEPGLDMTFTATSGGWTPEQSATFTTAGAEIVSSFLTGVAVGGTFQVNDEGTWRQFTVTSKSAADRAEVSPAWMLGSNAYTARRPLPPVNFTAEIQSAGEMFVVMPTGLFSSATDVTATAVVHNGAESEWTSWMTSDSQTATAAWMNVTAIGGLYRDDGKGQTPITVAYQFEIRRLDGSDIRVVNSILTGQGQDMRAETVEFQLPWVGAFQVRARRTTPYDSGFQGAIVDEIKWSDLYAISRVDRQHFGNKTTIQTVMYATPRATASRSRQLNCWAFRRLPTYNGTSWSGAFDADGRHVSGTISTTARASDIIGAMVTDRRIGNRPISDADMGQIYATQLQIEAWRPDCAQFNYTFDSKDASLEDMIGTVAAAVFCTAFRQSGRIRLFFDRPQTKAQTLFSHRNKRPNAETFTRSFRNDSDYDGVELTYSDRLSTQPEKIRLPLDGSARHYKIVEMPGVTSFEQAWMQANRQYNRLLNQRVVVETEVTQIGRLVTPGSLVSVVDNTRFRSYDGNVIGQSGLTLKLSQPVDVEPTSDIVLMRRDGSVESIPVTAGADRFHVVLARYPSQPLVTQLTAEGGEPTEFSVASNDRRKAQTMLVKEVSRSDGEYVKITAVNYSDAYYAADYQPIPPRESVINAT